MQGSDRLERMGTPMSDDTRDEAQDDLFEASIRRAAEAAGDQADGAGEGLLADIVDAAQSSRDTADPGRAVGRARIVMAEDPAHQPIAEALARLAGELGLDASVVAIELNEDAAVQARNGGTFKVAIEGCIQVDAATVDPYSPRGREAAAQEMGQLARWRLARDPSVACRCFVAAYARAA